MTEERRGSLARWRAGRGQKWLPYIALVLAGAAVLLPQISQPPRPLAELVPSSPLIYVEAKDFAGLIRDWNSSAEKKTWLAGDNYQVFSRSRLFLRFTEAQQEFAEAAGLNPDMPLAEAVAGAESAVALYDIANLEFLYITRMPQARAYQTLLWQSRAKFQPRQSAGVDYFVRQAQRRLAAFAVTHDLLVIATQEQAMASALALIAGQSPPAMRQETWYQRATTAQTTAGDIRMVLNFGRVARTPHFRSYWVQGNTRDLMSFNTVIADLDRRATEWRERRSLFRAEASVDRRPAEAAVGQISRYVPADAGLFRAWARPETAAALAAIQQVILPATAQPAENRNFAPTAGDADATLGSEQDLETRIDEEPVADESAKLDLQPLRAALEGNTIEAMLQVETSALRADGVFTALPAAVAISGDRPWNAAAVRSAIESTLGKVWTIAGIGTGFSERPAHWTITGLGRVSLGATGNLLVIANSEDLLASVLGRAAAAPAIGGATYAMRFLHARELPAFRRITSLIDFPALRGGAGEAREPLFFSGNIASLGRALGRIDLVSLESHDDGNAVTETVVYRLR